MHEGRYYNYAKPGAVEYSSTQGAQAALNAAKAAADAIHGLGRVSPTCRPCCRHQHQLTVWRICLASHVTHNCIGHYPLISPGVCC